MAQTSSEDTMTFKAWRLATHVLCIGLIAMGTLHVVAVSLWLLVKLLLAGDTFLGVFLKLGWILLALGFVWVGLKGLRIRSRRDVEGQLAALDERRGALESWINGPRTPPNKSLERSRDR
jgi:hypothetical protein